MDTYYTVCTILIVVLLYALYKSRNRKSSKEDVNEEKKRNEKAEQLKELLHGSETYCMRIMDTRLRRSAGFALGLLHCRVEHAVKEFERVYCEYQFPVIHWLTDNAAVLISDGTICSDKNVYISTHYPEKMKEFRALVMARLEKLEVVNRPLYKSFLKGTER